MKSELLWDAREQMADGAATIRVDYAVGCTNRHAFLIGDIPFPKLYKTPLKELVPVVVRKLQGEDARDIFEDRQQLSALLWSLWAELGELTIYDISTRPLSDFCKPELKLLGEIKGVGLALPMPTDDEQLRARRVVSIQALLDAAPGTTLKSLFTELRQNDSAQALKAVRDARESGALATKPPPPPPPPPAGPTLANCSVIFHTTDENKDHDTLVTVTVRDENNVTVAFISDYFGEFTDQSINGPYQLTVENPSDNSALTRGSVTVRIDPNGHDTWRFNFDLDLLFSDNQHRSAHIPNLQLTQNQKEQTFGLEGKMRA